jgi:hypothetical protein
MSDKKLTANASSRQRGPAHGRAGRRPTAAATGRLVSRVVNVVDATTKNAVTDDDRHRMIAEAAYFLAEKRGFANGDPVADWTKAEGEIEERLSAFTAEPVVEWLEGGVAIASKKLIALKGRGSVLGRTRARSCTLTPRNSTRSARRCVAESRSSGRTGLARVRARYARPRMRGRSYAKSCNESQRRRGIEMTVLAGGTHDLSVERAPRSLPR